MCRQHQLPSPPGGIQFLLLISHSNRATCCAAIRYYFCHFSTFEYPARARASDWKREKYKWIRVGLNRKRNDAKNYSFIFLFTSLRAATMLSCSLIWSVSVVFSVNFAETFPSSSSWAFCSNILCRVCTVYAYRQWNIVYMVFEPNAWRMQQFTCKWFQFCSSSLTAFSVSLISLCVSAHSAFNVVCSALYACRTKRKWEKKIKCEFVQRLNGSDGERWTANANTFFLSSQSSFSRTIFSFSGCSSCIKAETRSRAAATARVKCVTKRDISITDDASFSGFMSSGRPLISLPPPPPSNLSPGMYNDGYCAFNFSSVDSKSFRSIWKTKMRN